MSILGAIAVPHPPAILPEVGRGQEEDLQQTVRAYRSAARQVADWAPEALVVTSPHALLYADYFHISPGGCASGDLHQFLAPSVRLTAEYDTELAAGIAQQAEECGLPAGPLGDRCKELDHATIIPLHFLQEAGVTCPIVRIGLSGLPPLDHYRLGKCIAAAADSLGRRVVLVASGDLSHKLRSDGPYGYAPQGPDFDQQVTAALASGDFLSLLQFDESFCESAAECGLHSFQMMAGALDGLSVQSDLLSYEAPFGVGYGVAVFTPTGVDGTRHFDAIALQLEQARLAQIRTTEDPWVRLARAALETYVQTGQRLSEHGWIGLLRKNHMGLPDELANSRAGVFVSLHKSGRLRGCIGTPAPVTGSVADEIIHNAIAAGAEDPRFPPVRPEELPDLEYRVDVLSSPQRIAFPSELDVKRYGVIVSGGFRRGLLLPDLEGVDTPEQQIDIARHKAGISPVEQVTLERFEVVRHT